MTSNFEIPNKCNIPCYLILYSYFLITFFFLQDFNKGSNSFEERRGRGGYGYDRGGRGRGGRGTRGGGRDRGYENGGKILCLRSSIRD